MSQVKTPRRGASQDVIKAQPRSVFALIRGIVVLAILPLFIVGSIWTFFIGIPSIGIAPMAPLGKIFPDSTMIAQMTQTALANQKPVHTPTPTPVYASLSLQTLYSDVMHQKPDVAAF